MFGDLDWPLNASCGLSATAEFLVFTVQYWINLQLLCWTFSSTCVCCIDQTFGRKHSLVAYRHQNNLSIQSIWHSVTGSGHRVKKRPGRVGLGHGSKVQAQFHLLSWKYVAELYIRWICIAEMAPHLPMQQSKIKKGNCGLHLRDDFQKCAYLCMAKRGLCFSSSHCLCHCLHCFHRLKLHYADTHTNKRIFICSFSYFWAAYTCLWFFRFCKTTDFATLSHSNLHTFVTLCWKLHACNHKCTIVHFLTANKMN